MGRHPRDEQPWHSRGAAWRYLDSLLGGRDITTSLLSSMQLGAAFVDAQVFVAGARAHASNTGAAPDGFERFAPGGLGSMTWLGRGRKLKERELKTARCLMATRDALAWFEQNRAERNARLWRAPYLTPALLHAAGIALGLEETLPDIPDHDIDGPIAAARRRWRKRMAHSPQGLLSALAGNATDFICSPARNDDTEQSRRLQAMFGTCE